MKQYAIVCLFTDGQFYPYSYTYIVYFNYIHMCFVFHLILYFSHVLKSLHFIVALDANFHLTVSVLFSFPVPVFVQ